MIQYIVVDTRNWLSGKKVVVAPVDHNGGLGKKKGQCDLTREQVENSLECKPLSPVDRVYEEQFKHPLIII